MKWNKFAKKYQRIELFSTCINVLNKIFMQEPKRFLCKYQNQNFSKRFVCQKLYFFDYTLTVIPKTVVIEKYWFQKRDKPSLLEVLLFSGSQDLNAKTWKNSFSIDLAAYDLTFSTKVLRWWKSTLSSVVRTKFEFDNREGTKYLAPHDIFQLSDFRTKNQTR